jgi:hypothetical protein
MSRTLHQPKQLFSLQQFPIGIATTAAAAAASLVAIVVTSS